MTRPQSGGRARPPMDQPEGWGHQLQGHHYTSQQARGNDDLYARIGHVETAAAVPGRRGAAAPAAGPPPRRTTGSCDGARPQPADLEVTLSPPSVAPAAALVAGSGSTGGMSLGHGPSAGFGAAGRGGGSHQGNSSPSQGESTRLAQEENARLRDQVQHLERLLAAVTPSSSLAAATGADARRGRKPPPTGRPSSAAGFTDASSPSIAAAAAGGVVLQQYKAQNKARLSLEVEGTLLEVASKLEDLAAGSSNSSSSRSGGGVGRVAPASGSDAASLQPGAAAEAAAAGYGEGGDGGGGEGLSREQLMQLHKWSKQMLGRLRSEKSESSKLFTQQAYDSGGSRAGGLLGGHRAASWGNRSAAAAVADGTSFSPSLVEAGAEAAPEATQQRMTSLVRLAAEVEVAEAQVLAALAPKLAALSVLLKTQLLPAMPWLGLEAADRLQAEVGEAAESVSQSVEALVQLCSLLPAGAAVFGEGPVAQEPKRRAAELDAGRDSWLYSSPELLDAPEPSSPSASDDDAAIAPLLRDRKTGSKALADILEPARVKSQASCIDRIARLTSGAQLIGSAAAKRAVLETELRFAARASALHAEHVSHLMLSVGMALEECRGAKDAAAIKSYFNAAAAVRQVLEGADALEVHPCETCLKALVDIIRVHRETLGRVPELLVNAPAADVEGRLLSKVEELHQGFKKAVSRLEAHKRRQLDSMAGGSGGGGGGGGGSAAREGDAGSDYDDDFEDSGDDERSGGGGEAGRTGQRGGSAGGREYTFP
ncbi:hypothetical protein VOLCADRAFT_95434 [Volvox carteri f. nagariensis]|uniref:Uncharacterized protein n=1 Tax=Volvox carteri f. nagariensis TaxID=3068 RepID=D8U7F9_VOLCA|nr:uncharacterized protein VOLCADRAFT_95434 [Volvox carteri f. nagariensis]EFJ44229.1 hypothetical protein VOLCADRAFT_95434 [Volvox carteri f. nagariensis]|eukprot:XP_002954588.1 hypothetical protein VOLCADRAFT_95434 [Volvox carteri f. nagariensis]